MKLDSLSSIVSRVSSLCKVCDACAGEIVVTNDAGKRRVAAVGNASATPLSIGR